MNRNARNVFRALFYRIRSPLAIEFMKNNSGIARRATTPSAGRPGEPSPAAPPATWTFLTNHAHVLICLYRAPDQRLRDVALQVGITERMVQKIVAELVEAGYLEIRKQGRCNSYHLHTAPRLRHPLESQHTIGELLELLGTV